MTVRVPQETKTWLELFVKATNITRSHLLDQAIPDCLNIHEWQALETKKAVNLANSPHVEWIAKHKDKELLRLAICPHCCLKLLLDLI